MVYELFSTGAPVITEGFQNNNKDNNDKDNNNNGSNRPPLTPQELDETAEMLRTIITSINTNNNKEGPSNSEKVLNILCTEGVEPNNNDDPQINIIATQINMMLLQLEKKNREYVLGRLCNETFQNFVPEDAFDEDGEDGEDDDASRVGLSLRPMGTGLVLMGDF